MSDAYAMCRELLRRAEDDAARVRADADRYLRQRQQEAELVVAKARRLLAIAEERAASIEQAAAEPTVIDLTDAAMADGPTEQVVADRGRSGSALDSILASAVHRALDRALPVER